MNDLKKILIPGGIGLIIVLALIVYLNYADPMKHLDKKEVVEENVVSLLEETTEEKGTNESQEDEALKQILEGDKSVYSGDVYEFFDEPKSKTLHGIPEATIHEGWPVVVLDAGHGGSDSGAGKGYTGYEKAHTMEIVSLVAKELQCYNINVCLTRDDDYFINRYDRIIYANSIEADAFVSVHRNSNRSSWPSGVSIYYGYAEGEMDEPLASRIMENIKEIPGTNLDYVRGNPLVAGTANNIDQDYVVNRYSLMAGCLIELGYISNGHDNYQYQMYHEDYAHAIATGIMDYLESVGFTINEIEES